jgi:hypothetical protein
MRSMNSGKFLKDSFIVSAMVPSSDNFLSAKFEAAIPTDAVRGYFSRTGFAAVTATWCMYLLTMNGFLHGNRITEFQFSGLNSVDLYKYACVYVCMYVCMYVCI